MNAVKGLAHNMKERNRYWAEESNLLEPQTTGILGRPSALTEQEAAISDLALTAASRSASTRYALVSDEQNQDSLHRKNITLTK